MSLYRPPVHAPARFLRRAAHPRAYSTAPPPPSLSKPSTPYIVGGIVGAGAVGLAGYAWYYLSGVKRVVDKSREFKERYEETKEAALERRNAARERLAAARAAGKERAESLTGRWKQRFQDAKSVEENDESSKEK